MSTFKVTGIDKVSNALRALAKSVPEQAAQALNAVAEETMTDAKMRTPVDTGNLRRTGKVHQHATPRRLSAGLSFGTEYALPVHEHPSKYSPPSWKAAEASGSGVHFSPSGTGPKFLENAIKFTAMFFEERIANYINFSKGGGTGAGSPGGSGNL